MSSDYPDGSARAQIYHHAYMFAVGHGFAHENAVRFAHGYVEGYASAQEARKLIDDRLERYVGPAAGKQAMTKQSNETT